MTHMYFKLPLLDFNSADELLCSCVSDAILPFSNPRLWYSGLCLRSNEGVRSLSSPVSINSFEIWGCFRFSEGLAFLLDESHLFARNEVLSVATLIYSGDGREDGIPPTVIGLGRYLMFLYCDDVEEVELFFLSSAEPLSDDEYMPSELALDGLGE